MKKIQELLSKYHTHAELCREEEIVYKESDMLEIIYELTGTLYRPVFVDEKISHYIELRQVGIPGGIQTDQTQPMFHIPNGQKERKLNAVFSNTITDRGDMYILNLTKNGLPHNQSEVSGLLLGSYVEIDSKHFKVCGVGTAMMAGDISILVNPVA